MKAGMSGSENAYLLRTENICFYLCFAHSVLFRADLQKVLYKSCPHGLNYGGEHLASLLKGVSSYSFS